MNGIFTKAWWENKKFLIRLLAFGPMFAAVFAAAIPAIRFNTETNNWFAAWTFAHVASAAGFGNTVNVPKRELPVKADAFLEVVCTGNARICQLYDQQSAKFFGIYPVIAAGATLVILLLVAGLGFKKKSDEDHRRGSEIADAKDLTKLLKKEPASIYFGGVPFPFADENRHLLLSGAPGSGKSVAIQTLLAAIRDRGDRAIVVDLGGSYTSRFARAGDALLNPFDERTEHWSPFSEGMQPWEIEAMARSLVPGGDAHDKIWSDLAKTVMGGLIEQCQQHGMATNHHLAGLATCGDPDLLAKILKGHPAYALISSDSKQTVGSILTNLGERGAGLRYLNPEAGKNGFSIGRWVREGEGWMFLGLQISQREALKNILAAQLDVACRSVLDLPPNEQRRVWLIVDELPLLGKVNSITEFLTNARKNGGAAVLGIQALSQLREIYGKDGATTMLSCLGSQLIFRTPDPETADYMSKVIGEHEIKRRNRSQGKTEQGISKNEQEQITNTRIVMAAELQNLPSLAGYFNLIGDRPTARIKLGIPKLNEVQKPFVPRTMPPRRPLAIPAHLLGKDATAPGAAAPAPEIKPEPAAPQADGDWMNQLDKE